MALARQHHRARPSLRRRRAEKNGGQEPQALGRSGGGFSTKIHIVVDGLGNPLDLVLTGGQVHDVTQAPTLLHGQRSDYMIADKGYDAADLIELIEAQGAIPVVPTRRNKAPRWYDRDL